MLQVNRFAASRLLVTTLIGAGLGSAIGSMTLGGGLAAAFDGTTSQAATAVARINTGSSGTVGKDWGSGVAKRVSKIRAWRPNDSGVDGGAGGGSLTYTLHGSNTGSFGGEEVSLGSAMATDYDGAVGSGGASPNADWQYVEFATTPAPYRYHRLTVAGAGSGVRCAELQFFEDI